MEEAVYDIKLPTGGLPAPDMAMMDSSMDNIPLQSISFQEAICTSTVEGTDARKPKKKKHHMKESSKISLQPNIHNVQRKLLILDINKVLIYRLSTSYYVVRPHAKEFLSDMAERFTLALWTSMKNTSAKKCIKELFCDSSSDLLFKWYQPKCTRLHAHSVDEKCTELPDTKPTFLKNLSDVWKEYSQYSESNTILLDDSPEKCINNPIYSSIQPLPFVLLQGEKATNDMDVTVDGDSELQRGGGLWVYLDSIARSHRDVQFMVQQMGPYSPSYK